MDMWPAYIGARLDAIPNDREKIAFDKFHVAKYLDDAVDKVRRAEHRVLLADGRDDLTRTRHHWLMNTQNMSLAHVAWFQGAARKHPENSSCLSHEGICDDDMEFYSPGLYGIRRQGPI